MQTELKRPRDQLLHDFVRAAIDALHAGVGIGAGDWIFHHVAIAAMKLQALVHDLALQICDPVFRHRRRGRVEFAAHHLLDAAVDEGPADLDLRLQLSDLMFCGLKIEHSLSEDLPLARIVDRRLQRGFGRGDPCDGDLKPLPGEFLHQEDEALALGSEARVAGKLDILEEEQGSALAPVRFVRSRREWAWRADRADALAPSAWPGSTRPRRSKLNNFD